VLCAFDLLELDGEDLRRPPSEGAEAAIGRGDDPLAVFFERDVVDARALPIA
jgi:hypothetical protein